MDICVSMVHDELEDFATPVKVQNVVDKYAYDNEQFNNEESESDDDEMDYNYGDEYFYWSEFLVSLRATLQNPPKFIFFCFYHFHISNFWNFCINLNRFFLPKKKKKETNTNMKKIIFQGRDGKLFKV